MKSRTEDVHPTIEHIKDNQKLFNSYALILKDCLENNRPEKSTCNAEYDKFEKQEINLEHSEKKLIDTLYENIQEKKRQFDKIFDPLSEKGKPVESLPLQFQDLKKEIKEDTAAFLNTRRGFESFRNNLLFKTINQNSNYVNTSSSPLEWDNGLPNKEINNLLQRRLELSNREMKSIDKRLEKNKSAPYSTTLEKLNAHAIAVTKLSRRG